MYISQLSSEEASLLTSLSPVTNDIPHPRNTKHTEIELDVDRRCNEVMKLKYKPVKVQYLLHLVSNTLEC